MQAPSKKQAVIALGACHWLYRSCGQAIQPTKAAEASAACLLQTPVVARSMCRPQHPMGHPCCTRGATCAVGYPSCGGSKVPKVIATAVGPRRIEETQDLHCIQGDAQTCVVGACAWWGSSPAITSMAL